MKKLWKNIKKKFGNGLTFIVVPNSTHRMKSLTIPFSLILVIIGVIVFNLYIFFMFTTQVFQLNQIQREMRHKDQSITRLKKEQEQVEPTLNRTYQMASELNNLKAERERIIRTWRSIQKKGGGGYSRTSRGALLRVQPYPSLSRKNMNESDIERLNLHNIQLDSYLKKEAESQKELLQNLLRFEIQLDHTPSLWPVSSAVTSWFGIRRHPIKGYYKEHLGVDLRARYGTRVLAAGDGVVREAGYKNGFGYTVVLKHGYGYETLYGHNSKILVRAGQAVKKGQVICLSGNSGSSTGPHLHYEVHVNNQPVNPITYLRN